MIEFFNRHSGQLEREAVYGEAPLKWVYGHALGRLALWPLIRRAWFSRWYGWRMDQPRSRAMIQPFIRKYGLNAQDFAQRPEDFAHFNAFFYRRLKPEARPIAAEQDGVVLPADGRHRVIADLSLEDPLLLKGQRFNLSQLLASQSLARRYERGSMLISRLCPTDYHRYHFPCDGLCDSPQLLEGPLSSVNPLALRWRPNILWENKRWLTRLRSDHFGEVCLLEIGATCVGSVVHGPFAGQLVHKGAEKGYFRFGGSCVILLFEPGRIRFQADLLEHSAANREVYAQMGGLAARSLTAGS